VVRNNGTRTLNVRVFDDALDFDPGAQEPGETVEIAAARAPCRGWAEFASVLPGERCSAGLPRAIFNQRRIRPP
jgi:hypothetical protein